MELFDTYFVQFGQVLAVSSHENLFWLETANTWFLNTNKVSANPLLLSAITPTPQSRKNDASF